MNSNLLKNINEYFNTFSNKNYTIYINGERIKFYKVTGSYVVWETDHDWGCLFKQEINAVTIEGVNLTITARDGKEYTFITNQ